MLSVKPHASAASEPPKRTSSDPESPEKPISSPDVVSDPLEADPPRPLHPDNPDEEPSDVKGAIRLIADLIWSNADSLRDLADGQGWSSAAVDRCHDEQKRSGGGSDLGMPTTSSLLSAGVLEVPQPSEPATPAVPEAPISPAVPDPGTPAAPEEPADVPAPEEPATPIVPEEPTTPSQELNPNQRG